MKCVVTGGAGFIGDHLCSELVRRGYDTIAFDRMVGAAYGRNSSARIVEGDVRDEDALVRTFDGVKQVFHLSGLLGTAELFDNPHEAIDVNIKGALNVLLAARRSRVERVFLVAKPNYWNNLYSVTSQAIEKLGASYRDLFGMDIRTLRSWNIYGPRQAVGPVRKAVPIFIRDALLHRPLQIHGDGSQRVDLMHVRDAVRAIADFLSVDAVQRVTYDLTATTRISVLELAQTVIRLAESRSGIEFLPMRDGEGPDVEIERGPDVQTIIPNNPGIPFLVGMRETIDWYRQPN